FEILGFSNTSWTGGALPLPLIALHPAAGVGCNLLARNDSVLFLVNSGGTATTSLSTPNVAAFAGLQMYEQIIQLELAGINITSMTASNGLEITLGAR
ncbi:MAG: hypothetical protein KDC98_17635, partial [Planctomycetes bacterium]|nr:hypothetical protein [Planctomycetota bacterium]